MKESLVKSEQRYRMLFKCSGDAMMEARPDGTVLMANSAVCEMFGMTEEEICKAGRAKLVAPDETRLQGSLEERQRNGSAKGHATLVRKDGSRFEAEVSSALYTAHDGTVLAVICLRDVTVKLNHAQQMVELNAQSDERVRQRTELLETANSELRSFAQSLAHDLRTPITTIGSFSGSWKSGSGRVEMSAPGTSYVE